MDITVRDIGSRGGLSSVEMKGISLALERGKGRNLGKGY